MARYGSVIVFSVKLIMCIEIKNPNHTFRKIGLNKK